MKRILSFVIVLSMLLSLISFNAGAKELIRRPYDNYYSVQNPPDFSWAYTHGATYSLKVATNKALTENVREVTGLTKNLYNFSEPFEPGEYYWSYKVNNGSYNSVYRFYIAENATEYPVKYDFDNLELNLPDSHPRLLITKDNIHYLKNITENDTTYKTLKSEVDSAMRSSLPTLSGTIAQSSISSKYTSKASIAARAALLYLTNDDDTYKQFGIDMLNALSVKNDSEEYVWAPENAITPNANGLVFNSSTDVYICLFAYYLGLAYDWLYNDLDETEIQNITGLMESVFKVIAEEWASGKNLDSYNIYKGFLGSHLYRLNQTTVAALSVYDNTDENSYAHQIVNWHLPVMINITHPFSYQDGGNAQGLFYGFNNDLNGVADILKDLGIIDLKSKPIFTNMPYRYLYNWNTGMESVFGDNYDNKAGETIHSYHYKTATQSIAGTTENPVMAKVVKWLYDDASDYFTNPDFYYNSHIETFFVNEKAKTVEASEPYMLPTAKYFKDIGWASFNSDLSDENRVSLRFKSSPYGSYNHSHPDQNSFVINAFGEYMAIDSDYYVAFHDTFDLSWNKKTYAHNAITYDMGNGQPYNMRSAEGNITDFLSSTELDLVTGDATTAYNVAQTGALQTNLSKAKRSILYLKPDVFLIIDDLKSASGEKNFEFWLNTRGNIGDMEGSKATVTQNGVSMFANCLYPEVTASAYIDNFNAPDGTEIASSDIPTAAKNGCDSRLCYTTGAVDRTKMITMLSVDDGDVKPAAGKLMEETEEYLTIRIADAETRLSTYIYINNGTDDEITVDNITFKGDIAVVAPESVMLVNGTKLIKDDITYIDSDVNVSAAIAGERISLSSIAEDSSVKLYTGAVEQIHKTEDEREVKLTENVNAYGIKYINNGEYTTFNLYPGAYTLNLNDNLHEGYAGIDVSAGEGGKVECETRVMKGEQVKVKVTPDDGYGISSMTFNGEEVYTNNNGEFLTPELTDNAIVTVTFAELEGIEPKMTTFDKIYTDNSGNVFEIAVFGVFENKGIGISDYGVIYSTENIDFKLEDVNGSSIRKLPSTVDTPVNKFGIQIFDSRMNISNVYARTYMIINGKAFYGDIVSHSK